MTKVHHHPAIELGASIAVALLYGYFIWTYTSGMWFYWGFVLSLVAYAIFTRSFHFLDITVCFLLVLAANRIYTATREGFESKKKSKQSKKKKSKQPKEEDEDDSDDDEDDAAPSSTKQSFAGGGQAPRMDMGSTWLQAYNKLNPEQVTSMKKDTKELMETQRALVETLQTMGPTVQQGMELVNTFSKFFGSGPQGANVLAPAAQ
jgi:hypothetical protein